jgi:hypothetical protein
MANNQPVPFEKVGARRAWVTPKRLILFLVQVAQKLLSVLTGQCMQGEFTHRI